MDRRQRGIRWGSFLAVTGVGVLLLWGMTQPLTAEAPDASAAPGFYAIGEAKDGLAIGERAPSLDIDVAAGLVGLDDAPLDTTRLAGRPVWVVFWATWCPPCQVESPDIDRVYLANRARGVEVLAVDVEEPLDTVRGFVDRYQVSYPVVLDKDGSMMDRWGVFGLPTHYFIDAEGIIRDRVFGPLKLEQMQERVDALAPDAP